MIGRFGSVDPLADDFYRQSPYAAMDNDPVNKVDPDGMAAVNWPISTGFNLGLNFGYGSSGFSYNLTGSMGVQFGSSNTNLTVFASGSLYGGSQLGTQPVAYGVNYDYSMGAYVNIGKGIGSEHNFYTLNYNTPSPFKNSSDLSVSWGQMITYNSAINAGGNGPGKQSQGIFGLRLGENFSLSTNNDATSAPYFSGLLRNAFGIKDTDAGWTGGIVLNMGGVELGYQNFSGYRLEAYPGSGVGKKYRQTPYHTSLNKASNFIQYRGLRAEYFSGAWFQNFIHNKISKESTYYYHYRKRGTFGNYNGIFIENTRK